MFYGNVTNTVHTSFQFDKIYSTRYGMDYNLKTDGIAPGRFVLISYTYNPRENGFSSFSGEFQVCYTDAQDQTISPSDEIETTSLFFNPDCTLRYQYTDFTKVDQPNANNIEEYYVFREGLYQKASIFTEGEIYYIKTNTDAGDGLWVTNGSITRRRCNNIVKSNINNPTPLSFTDDFFICIGPLDLANPKVANFKPLNLKSAVVDPNFTSVLQPYLYHFEIDLEHYAEIDDSWGILQRGYDNTVWEKVIAEGVERYILVARLNASAPGFNLVAEPPTYEPIAPFIGNDSTNDVYNLHIQSPWGFEVKPVELPEIGAGEEIKIYSDENGEKYTYSYNPETGKVEQYVEQVPLEIYYNKKGFSKEIRTYIDPEELEDHIKVSPTGQSQDFDKKYANSAIKDPAAADIYQLSINLPTIGNTISNIYDLIYGEGDKQGKRPLDVEWYTPSDGDKRINGTENNKSQDFNTVAGIINQMHNRLGQIVEEVDGIDLPSSAEIDALWDDNLIYYFPLQNKFYRRGTKYKYTDIDMLFEKIELTELTWEPAIYYIKDETSSFQGSLIDGNKVPLKTDINDTFQAEAEYYRRYLNEAEGYYREIELTQYEAGKFWYRDGNNFIIDKTEGHPQTYNRRYVTVKEKAEYTFRYQYKPNAFYKKDKNDNYILSTDEVAQGGVKYYTINLIAEHKAASTYPNMPGTWIYIPDFYFYYADQGVTIPPVQLTKATEQIPVSGREYYYAVLSKTPSLFLDSNGNYVYGYAITDIVNVEFNLKNNNKTFHYLDDDTNNFYKVTREWLLSKPASFFYQPSDNYYNFTDYPDDIIEINDEMYVSNVYYYKKNNDNSYFLAGPEDFIAGRNYYELTDIKPVNKFYQPNTYYWSSTKNSLDYYLDASLTMQKTGYYFEKIGLFVTFDARGECPYGYEWNPKITTVPWPFILQAREDIVAAIELYGISNGKFSVNGLILQLAKLLEIDNVDIRNLTTVQGVLNTASDKFYSLGTLKPGYVVYVNEYGRLTSGTLKYSDLLNAVGGDSGGFSHYNLPIASKDTLGGIKTSDSIAVDAETGIASATLTDNIFASDSEVNQAIDDIFK